MLLIGEFAVAGEVEALKTHQGSPRFRARMQPGEHVLGAFLHQFRDGGLEGRFVGAEKVPAFLRQLRS